MNNYEQDANVILKMTKVVHSDYVVNSIAQFLKERDSKQKLNIASVSGKRPYRCANCQCELILDDVINDEIKLHQAACASGAVAKTVSGGFYCGVRNTK